MPWFAPIIGYVDTVGRLRCSECAEERHRDVPVSGDQWPSKDDVCETCGWKFIHIRSRDYVQVADGYPVPDLKRSGDRTARSHSQTVA